jgi:hypothetical protein
VSDFVTRLEHELVEAFERQDRRRRVPVPRLRPLVPALAVAAALALALVLVLPLGERADDAPVQPGPVPAQLAGSYTGADGLSLILDVRRYTLQLPGRDPQIGDARGDGGVLLLGNDGDGPCGLRDFFARYAAVAEGGTLRLTLIDDACAARARALDGAALRRDG